MWRWIISFVLIVTSMSIVIAQEPPADDSIIAYDSTVDAIIEELETSGRLPSGTTPLLAQAQLSYSGERPQFSNFTTENSVSDFVMGATLTFDPQQASDDALEYCGLAGRTQRIEENTLEDGSNVTTIRLAAYLAIGVDNAGNIFAFETDDDPDADLSPLEIIEADLALDEPVYLLAISLNDMLSVYANGDLLISDYPLTGAGGAFSFLYLGSDADSSCTTETLFVYTLPEIASDECIISSERVVNRRAGAGTNFGVVGQFTGAETLPAVGQQIGTEGFTWWLLDDDSWVREDVVTALGYCRTLPVIENAPNT